MPDVQNPLILRDPDAPLPARPPRRWGKFFAGVLLLLFVGGEGLVLWEVWLEQRGLRTELAEESRSLAAVQEQLRQTSEAQSSSQRTLSQLQDGLQRAQGLVRDAADQSAKQLETLQQQLSAVRATANAGAATLQATSQLAASFVVPIACGTLDRRGEFTADTSGSGTILTPDGLLLSNYHVVSGPDGAPPLRAGRVLTCAALYQAGGAEQVFALAFLRGDADEDVAYLKMIPTAEGQPDPADLASLLGAKVPLCDDGELVVTRDLIIMGYPAYGTADDEIPTTLTTTRGTVSQAEEDGYIATDAKIDHGNSGGAAFLDSGCFIGIPTAISAKEGGMTESLGYIKRVSDLTP